MNLFSNINDHTENLLPYDGIVNYYGKVLDSEKADHYYRMLMKGIEWKNDEAIIYGKRIITKRKVAWYGQSEFNYTYSNTTKRALTFTKELLELKELCEQRTGETFNSCLLNLYHDGNEGMAWHSDAEKDLKKNGTIASLSFGAERRFGFKHKANGQTIYLVLENGSLLTMSGQTQTFWLHRLPPAAKIFAARINLTFRTIIENE